MHPDLPWLCQLNGGYNEDTRHTHTVPAVILADEALIELVHHRTQHGTGIIGKVQISDLHHRNRDDGERLLVLFGGTCSQLQEGVLLIYKELTINHLESLCARLNLADN